MPFLFIQKGDIVLWITHHYTPFQDWLFSRATLMGDGLAVPIMVLILCFVKFKHAITMSFIGIAHALIINIFKRGLFHHAPRPKNVLPNELLHFVPGVDVHGVMSFPSGHTTTAFAVAFFVFLITDKKVIGYISLFAALMVAYSRMYLLQHFYMDVFFGAYLGSLIAYGSYILQERIKLPGWAEYRIFIRVAGSKSQAEADEPQTANS